MDTDRRLRDYLQAVLAHRAAIRASAAAERAQILSEQRLRAVLDSLTTKELAQARATLAAWDGIELAGPAGVAASAVCTPPAPRPGAAPGEPLP